MSKKIVGLDLGSNSVGWSVVEAIVNSDGKEEIVNIVAAGSRIVPMDPNFIKEFETGLKMTKNAERRQKRGARRLLQRYHQRRDNLVEVLRQMKLVENAMQIQKPGFLPQFDPEFSDLVIAGKAKPAWYPYFLRHKALTKKITLPELATVLYQLNQRRGYKDIGDLMDELAGIEEKDEKGYSKTFEIVRIVSVEKENDTKAKKELYTVRLDDGRECSTIVKALTEMAGQERELEVRVKTNKKGEVSYELALPDNAAWQYRLDALDKKLDASKLTPGAYYWQRLLSEPHYRVKQNLVYRDRYLQEFDAIMTTQERFHPELNDRNLFKRIVKALIPNNKSEQNRWNSGSLKQFLRNYIIYYQRPLKSQRRMVDVCRYEKGYRSDDQEKKVVRPAFVMAISHPLYQEFRLWQDLAHLGFKDPLGEVTLLTNAEKERLYTELREVGELTQSAVYKLLGKDKKMFPTMNLVDDKKKILGNATLHLLKKALAKVATANLRILTDDEEVLERVWHLLFSVADQQARKKSLVKQFGFTEAEAAAISTVNFPKGYGNLSYKAVKKLLPLMRCGKYYVAQDVCANAVEKINKMFFDLPAIIEKMERGERLEKGKKGNYERNPEDSLTNDEEVHLKLCNNRFQIEDFQGLKYWEAARLVYGSHSSNNDDAAPYKSPDEIRRLPLHSLRNPVVEQVVNEALMVMKDIWKQYGKPDKVVVELAREMKMTADDRKKMTKSIGESERERAKIARILADEFGIANPSRGAILKYQLWTQQRKRCIYSGKTIQDADLFSGAVDVDHIIPRQRYFDDSQNNKVLAFKSENLAKSNKTAFEYMHETGRWDSFLANVESLKREGQIKRQKYKYLTMDKIPEDFVNRQLQETRYIAARMTLELKRMTPVVNSSVGMITDHLKQSWRLNEVFKEVQLPRFERLERLFPEVPWIQRVKDLQGHDVLQLYGWDKRIDHRHHALDAIIVACTTQSMVNQLNRLNALYGKLQAEGRPAQHFPLPFTGFYNRLREVLAGIVVSVKCTDKLASKAVNSILKLDPETQRYYRAKQETTGWAVRGALHNEQPLGQVVRQEKMPVPKVLDTLAQHPELLDETSIEKRFLAVDWQREAIRKHVAMFGGDYVKMKKGLSKIPLVNDFGKSMAEVTVWKRYYSKTRSIDTNLTLKQVELIIDPVIKKELKELLKQFGNDPKKAFTTDILLGWNSARKLPVYTVKCRMDEAEVGSSEGRTLLTTNPLKNFIKFVEKGDNYALIVEENMENNKRSFQILSFFDAVGFKMTGIPIFSEKPGFKSFILRKGSLVYVPLPGENIATSFVNSAISKSNRLYRLMKSSGSDIYFLPNEIAKVMNYPDKDKSKSILEFGSQSRTMSHKDGKIDINIIKTCVPVQIDRLGNILRIGL
ncbi:MAG: type II CRISPR RNA-guided endonuclease Cas9 [Bacteroidales bacterium]|nr:type II CRISPR RNA-guided endonuclease Cas9 [Bacteroidales bacterium]